MIQNEDQNGCHQMSKYFGYRKKRAHKTKHKLVLKSYANRSAMV